MDSNSYSDAKSEFISVLDFILNRCDVRQIDAVEAAVKRRKKNLGAFQGLSTLDPEKLAKDMNKSIQESLEKSIEGMKASLREYAEGLIKKEAPEISPEDMEVLLDNWFPPKGGKRGRKKKIPVEMMETMVLQFVERGWGDCSALKDEDFEAAPGWERKYWNVFPPEIKALIKSRTEGELSDMEFQAALSLLLGSYGEGV